MGTTTSLDSPDAFRRECFVADQELLVFACEDVVCDGGYGVSMTDRAGEWFLFCIPTMRCKKYVGSRI
jgi:hypothetical protein